MNMVGFHDSIWRRALNHCLGTVVADIAKSRAEIEGARLLVLSAALQVSSLGQYGTNAEQSARSTSTGRRVH